MFTVIRSLLAICIALLVATLLIFISANGDNFAEKLHSTGEALKQMLIGPLFRMSAKKGTSFEFKRLADILAAMIPTIFTGLSVCIMFAANQFNMGAEGGIMLGAFVTALVAVYWKLPGPLLMVVAVLAGGIAVALVMLIPAVLKAKLGVSEMVNSLMLNYVIMYLIGFLMNSYLADTSKGITQTYPFQENAMIPQLVENGSRLSWGFVVGLIIVVLCWFFMYRTKWGYGIRMTGLNQPFVMYSGMNVALIVILAQVLGGFLAGFGGGIEMLGRYNVYNWKALPGYGWTGITVAILAGNNPIYVPLAALFMSYLTQGCSLMSTNANVPAQMISIIQAVIFLLFAAKQFLAGYRQKLVVQSAKEERAALEKGGNK